MATTEASCFAGIDRDVNASKSLASDTFCNSHQFHFCAAALVGNANALQTADFFLVGHASQFLASFYAAGIGCAAAAVLSCSNHWATESDTHDRRKNKFEHWSSL